MPDSFSMLCQIPLCMIPLCLIPVYCYARFQIQISTLCLIPLCHFLLYHFPLFCYDWFCYDRFRYAHFSFLKLYLIPLCHITLCPSPLWQVPRGHYQAYLSKISCEDLDSNLKLISKERFRWSGVNDLEWCKLRPNTDLCIWLYSIILKLCNVGWKPNR